MPAWPRNRVFRSRITSRHGVTRVIGSYSNNFTFITRAYSTAPSYCTGIPRVLTDLAILATTAKGLQTGETSSADLLLT